MSHLVARLTAALFMVPVLAGLSSAYSAPLSEAEMTSFLVQCIGTDAAGHPILPAPGDGRCIERGLQMISAPTAWSKHDWPDRRNAEEVTGGQQASDSVLDEHLGFPVIVQTFDFGNAGRRFKALDRAGGDGGDALTILNGAAWIFFTEDGGLGQQWFMGEGCRGGDPRAKLASWLAFGSDVVEGVWAQSTASYKMTRSPEDCPFLFGTAYTRYRRAVLPVPIRAVDGSRVLEARSARVDTILSEHFGGPSIDGARHMERFHFGRGLGKYRWEAWEEGSRSRLADVAERARYLAGSDRCARLPGSEPPAAGWLMIDCRTWTNLVRERTRWSVAEFGWPGSLLDSLGRPEQ